MTKKQLSQYRDQLTALLTRIQGTTATLEEQARTALGGEAGGGLSNAPLHLGDVGSETYAQELGATLLENETYIRDEAAAALDRTDRGTFGRCEECGTAIVPERLEALPYARYCTACAARLGSGRAVNFNDGRPEGWLSGPGAEGNAIAGSMDRTVGRELGAAPDDVHAAGTPGGGSAEGGLAGTNVGGGSPAGARLEGPMGNGVEEVELESADGEEQPGAFAGTAGGAVGGTPANKRARGGATKSRGGATGTKTEPKKGRAKPRRSEK